MDGTEMIGSIAATLTTVCFIPQAYKVIRYKQTRDLSAVMYVLYTVGVGFWLAYGLLLESRPMMVANSVTLILAATILAMKLKYR